jgi:hypothetical protein
MTDLAADDAAESSIGEVGNARSSITTSGRAGDHGQPFAAEAAVNTVMSDC